MCHGRSATRVCNHPDGKHSPKASSICLTAASKPWNCGPWNCGRRTAYLLQAIARTNRPVPEMKKRTGVIVDYFGVFANLEKALNFDESVREESLIDWDSLKRTVPGEVARCMKPFKGIAIEETRACLLAALRRLRDPDVAKDFEHNFKIKSIERLWEAVAPDPCLYPHRHEYNWLCVIYVAWRRRQRGSRDTYWNSTNRPRNFASPRSMGKRFPEIANSIAALDVQDAIIDGEIVALTEKGGSSFQGFLRPRLSLADPMRAITSKSLKP